MAASHNSFRIAIYFSLVVHTATITVSPKAIANPVNDDVQPFKRGQVLQAVQETCNTSQVEEYVKKLGTAKLKKSEFDLLVGDVLDLWKSEKSRQVLLLH